MKKRKSCFIWLLCILLLITAMPVVDFTEVQAASVNSTFTGWKTSGGKKYYYKNKRVKIKINTKDVGIETKENKSDQTPKQESKKAKTGDDTQILENLMLLISSLGGILFGLRFY